MVTSISPQEDGSVPLYAAEPVRPQIIANSSPITTNQYNGNSNQRTSEQTNGLHKKLAASDSFTQQKLPPSAESTRIVQSSFSKCSRSISSGLENAFFCYGKTVATYPCLFILFCAAFTGICAIGLLTFTTEERPFKLWIPQDSDFIRIAEWQKTNFPNKFRIHSALIEADNVLTPEAIKDLLDAHDVVSNTVAYVSTRKRSAVSTNSSETGEISSTSSPEEGRKKVTWGDVCAQLPSIITGSIFGRRKRSVDLVQSRNIISNEDLELVDELQAMRMANHRNFFGFEDLESAEDMFSSIYNSLNRESSGPVRRKRQAGIDWSTLLPRGSYCSLIEQINTLCFEQSLLEVWGYDRETIESLTQDEIIYDVNNAESSQVYGVPLNVTKFLSGIERNDNGEIVSAKAMTQLWLSVVNPEKIAPGEHVDEFGTGTEIDVDSHFWEEQLETNLLNFSQTTKSNFFFMSAGSFGKISRAAIEGDLGFMVFGYMVVFIYVQIMLGKFNGIETRPFLSFLGITAVMMAIVVSYGLCSAIGLMFGPVNNILPFLLLGLGIDDMFVIMQAWNNLSEEEKRHPLNVRIGYAMKHAGASITVTSATDIVAFAIGSTTVLPALRSFCVYAAIGILAVFFFQATYFVAWLTFDQRRIESRRHGLLCCYKVSDSYKVNECSQKDLCQSFFGGIYSDILLNRISKIIVLLFTSALFATSCWGFYNLEQEFDAIWFLPQDSYLFKYFIKRNHYFSLSGIPGEFYLGNVTLHEELPQIEALVQSMEDNEYIGDVDSWYTGYKKYFEGQDFTVPDPDITYESFQEDLGAFLFSPSGSKYRTRNFQFDGDVNCLDPAPRVTASSIGFRYRILKNTREEITAMHSLKNIAENSNISGLVLPYSRMHSGWETDEIIEKELYQNMALALLVVFLMTFALIASMLQSLLVLICVIMTLVDVFALMHWWGLTIDTVSCIDMVLAIGLCVDYAAHVGHVFMTCTGSRDDRVRRTLLRIGPAVLNGGFSTFLAFCFLSLSNSHVFKTFFKVFFGVCLYGLYHGLVFLPVLLSLIGPNPYAQPTPSPIEMRQVANSDSPPEDRDYQPIPPQDKINGSPMAARVSHQEAIKDNKTNDGIVYIDEDGDAFVDASSDVQTDVGHRYDNDRVPRANV